MTNSTKAELAKLDLLYDQQDTSTPSSGTIAKIGQESAAGIQLLSNELAEISVVMVETPLDSNGAAEKIEHIKLIIDGKEWNGDEFFLRADNDSLQAIPDASVAKLGEKNQLVKRTWFSLGKTLPELLRAGVKQNPAMILENTTAKVKEKGTINVEYKIGNAAITDNFRVMMWGVKYTTKKVAEWYMKEVYGGSKRINLVDPKTGRQFETNIAPTGLRSENWSTLIGGVDHKLQGNVEVKPFNIWARNSTATTASVKYPLSFSDSKVDDPEQNMDFDIDDEEVRIIKRIGVRPHSNHLDTLVEANGTEIFRDRIRDDINRLNFGRITGIGPTVEPSDHEYLPLGTLEEPLYGHNETLKVVIVDSGTAIADGSNHGNGSLLVINGIRIKDPNLKQRTVNVFEQGAGVGQPGVRA